MLLRQCLSKCEILAKGGFTLFGRIKSVLTAKTEYKEEMKEKISLPKYCTIFCFWSYFFI